MNAALLCHFDFRWFLVFLWTTVILFQAPGSPLRCSSSLKVHLNSNFFSACPPPLFHPPPSVAYPLIFVSRSIYFEFPREAITYIIHQKTAWDVKRSVPLHPHATVFSATIVTVISPTSRLYLPINVKSISAAPSATSA